MGLKIRKLVKEVSQPYDLRNLRNKKVGIDAYNQIYTFLSAIRNYQAGKELFTDAEGNVTSHLIGLKNRLIFFREHEIKPVYVFDGEPPSFKAKEIKERRARRNEAEEKYEEAMEEEDYYEAAKYAIRTSKITPQIIEDTKRLLDAFGVPYIQAPEEAEAQLALMTQKGDIFAAATQDYDALLFGTSQIIRNVSISKKKQVKGTNTKIERPPEFITLATFLEHHGISQEQLIALALLIGTDYNKGVYGIGQMKGLKLVKKYPKFDNLIVHLKKDVLTGDEESTSEEKWKQAFEHEPEALFDYFMYPKTVEDYQEELRWHAPDFNEIIKFLSYERGFNKDNLIKSLKGKVQSGKPTKSLMGFFDG